MTNKKLLLGIWSFPAKAMAYAGPIDRFHDMLYCMMDGIWPVTIVCGILYAIHLLNRKMLRWLGLTAKWTFIVLWTTLLISLFDSWPLYLGELTAPIYLWAFFRVIRDRRVYPEEKNMPWYKQCCKWLYRCCTVRALILTVPFLFVFSFIRYAIIEVGEFCRMCVPVPHYNLYRYSRDTIFDSYFIDINYITGTVLLLSLICLFLGLNKLRKRHAKLLC